MALDEEEMMRNQKIFFETEIKVGPNPTYGEVNFYGDLSRLKFVEVYSITGELIHMIDQFNFSQTIDLYQYPTGIYFIRIINFYDELTTFKIMKR